MLLAGRALCWPLLAGRPSWASSAQQAQGLCSQEALQAEEDLKRATLDLHDAVAGSLDLKVS